MRTRVEKCRGGFAVVVPKTLAVAAGLHEGGTVDVELSGGRLVIQSAGPTTLAELLAGITPDKLRDGWCAGLPIGSELL